MTREEAIKHLQNDWFMSLGGQLCVDGDKKDAFLEAVGMSIKALRPVSREQVEKMRGEWIKPHWKNSTSCAVCSQCGFEAHHHEYHGVQDTYLFCPRCMAPMTDEAVEMVMERWEVFYD